MQTVRCVPSPAVKETSFLQLMKTRLKLYTFNLFFYFSIFILILFSKKEIDNEDEEKEIRFDLKKKISSVYVNIKIYGEHDHSDQQSEKRQIRGLERVEIAKKINEKAHGSAKFYRSQEIAKKGTSTGVPSEATLRKIVSEGENIAYKGQDWLPCLLTSINSKHQTIIGNFKKSIKDYFIFVSFFNFH